MLILEIDLKNQAKHEYEAAKRDPNEIDVIAEIVQQATAAFPDIFSSADKAATFEEYRQCYLGAGYLLSFEMLSECARLTRIAHNSTDFSQEATAQEISTRIKEIARGRGQKDVEDLVSDDDPVRWHEAQERSRDIAAMAEARVRGREVEAYKYSGAAQRIKAAVPGCVTAGCLT